MIEIDYSDPVVQRMLAVNEAANASFNERVEKITTEHAKSMENTLKESKEKLEQSKAAYAAERRKQQAAKEDPHRWPEREKKNRVLSFREEQEQQAATPAPPPPPPPSPAPKPTPKPAPAPEPQPSAAERPRKGKVLNFSTEDEDDGFQGFRRRR